MTAGPYSGLKVVDLTRVLAGPYCTMMLADLGAIVIKVEAPGSGDDARHIGPFIKQKSAYFMSLNRGKHSVALDLKDPVVVSPDAGGVERARAIAKRLGAGLAIIDKRREGPNSAVAMHLIGDVDRRDAVVIDDMIDTAGTLVQAVGAIQREGARRILACGVHPVLSGPAIERIKTSVIEEVVVTNSIPLAQDKRAAARITVLTVAPLLGEAIRRIHDEESVSTLFV